MRIGFIILCLFLSIMAFANVYEETKSDGSIVYSDVPNEGSIPTTLPAVNSVSSPLPPEEDKQKSLSMQTTDKQTTYKTFMISQPKNQETIQNQPTLDIQFTVEPALQKGDKIKVMLDDAPVAEVTTPEVSLSGVERGSHTIGALLLDANNNTLKRSPSVIVYIHKTSALNP